MATQTNKARRAHAEMERQEDLSCCDGYNSLDAMWRACGSPEGKDPQRWLRIAVPLIAGWKVYIDALPPEALCPDDMVMTFVSESTDPDDDCWREGDTMCVGPMATFYAWFLDFPDRPLLLLTTPPE